MDDAVIVKVDHLNLAEVKIASGLEKAIRALAFGLQAQAQENIRANGTIDTGALFNSVYTETADESGRDSALSAAQSAAASPGKKTGKPHLANPATPVTDVSGQRFRAKVGVCVEYGLYVEMGTVHTGAHPYMAPAVDKIKAKAQSVVEKFIAEEVK